MSTAHKKDAIKTQDPNLICGVQQILWQNGNWAKRCDFLDPDIEVLNSMT